MDFKLFDTTITEVGKEEEQQTEEETYEDIVVIYSKVKQNQQ